MRPQRLSPGWGGARSRHAVGLRKQEARLGGQSRARSTYLCNDSLWASQRLCGASEKHSALFPGLCSHPSLHNGP